MPAFDAEGYRTRILPQVRARFAEGGIGKVDPFLRFGLELVEDNETRIREQIDAVRKIWAGGFNHPRDQQMFRALHVDRAAEQQLTDSATRAALRTALVEERKKEDAARFAELETRLRIVAADGYLTPEARTDLITEFTARGLGTAEIEARVNHLTVRSGPTVVPLEEGLPANVRAELKKHLAVLQKPDLYAFLGVSSTANASTWTKALSDAGAVAARTAAGVQLTAMNSLLGLVKTHIVTSPARYEAARTYDLAEPLERLVRSAAGSSNLITLAQFTELLKEGLGRGLTDPTVRQAIYFFADRYKIRVQTDSKSSGVILCPHCHRLVEGATPPEQCPFCKGLLWEECPECATRMVVGAETCSASACRYPIGNHARLAYLLLLFDQAIVKSDLAGASESLTQAESLWGGGRVAAARTRLNDAEHARETQYKKFQTERAARHLYAASELLRDLSRNGGQRPFRDGKTQVQLEAELAPELARTEAKVREGEQHRLVGRYREAVTAFEEARRLATDCAAATAGIARCPPEPPTNASVTVLAESIQLRWHASAAVGECQYRVVRRKDRFPQSPQDGERVWTGAEIHCEDTGAEPGYWNFYAIFTERAGTISTPLTAPEVLGAFEARDIRISAGDSIVRGTWALLPANGQAIVTRRQDRPPDRAGDGDTVSCGPHGFEDTNIRNGTAYFYHVAVMYRTPQVGKSITTVGVGKQVLPDLPPESPANVRLTSTPGQILLTWSPPTRGRVQVYDLSALPANANGASSRTIPTSELASWGQPVPLRSVNEVALPRSGATQRARYFVPVVVVGDKAAVGNPIAFLDIADVTEVQAHDLQEYIQVQWRWPGNCKIVRVAWRLDGYPTSPDDPQARYGDCTLDEYNRNGGFRASPSAQVGTFHFAVFPGVVAAAGAMCFGGGLSAGSRASVLAGNRATVSYRIRRAGFFGKKYTLTLESPTGGAARLALPDMVLICRTDGIQPTSSDQGVTLLHLNGVSAPSTHGFELTVGRGYLRLFFADQSRNSHFQLQDPLPDQLRIGV